MEGFGLGLSITRKLLSLMNGTLALDSTPGKGSDFTILLPLPLADNQSLPDVTAEAPDAGEAEALPLFEGQDVYCLLVDDDPLQLALTEELLKQSQRAGGRLYEFRITSYELLRNTVFNAIITDIQMPTLDGYHLLERIRTSGIPGTDEIPVIALSASIAKGARALSGGWFHGFLEQAVYRRPINLLAE